MVKDQRLDTVPRALDSRRTRRRWQTAGSIVIVVVAFAVIVVPHFLSMSPTTGKDNDPTNGVRPTSATSAPDAQRE